MHYHTRLSLLMISQVALPISLVWGVDDFDSEPISYRTATPNNHISRLQQDLKTGATKLKFDDEAGYLPSLLQALEISADSQMLVFSKTSLQQTRIAPQTPRAIYFNDEVYIGYCQSGDVVELSVADPQLGTVFYTLDQLEEETPRFTRQIDNCLICHSSSRTKGVPGHLVRSLFVDVRGQPIFSAGSKIVDHTTPLEDRWGGWYVTGRHGSQSHHGNMVIPSRKVPDNIDNAGGHNVVNLADRLDVQPYLSPHSDIVALMVHEHQTMVHNQLTKSAFSVRQALHHEATMNQVLDRPADHRLESTKRRIANAGDQLVRALLLVDEAELIAPVQGTSDFSATFSDAGKKDSTGRSLKDLNLQTRLFEYPCSYLIYSESFDALPDALRTYVWRQLWNILHGRVETDDFDHLSDADRVAIIEVIQQTKPNLPRYWQ